VEDAIAPAPATETAGPAPFKSIRMQGWRNARSPLASYAMPNRWLHDELGLIDLSTQKTGLCVPVT